MRGLLVHGVGEVAGTQLQRVVERQDGARSVLGSPLAALGGGAACTKRRSIGVRVRPARPRRQGRCL
jgi:hypothetical protein